MRKKMILVFLLLAVCLVGQIFAQGPAPKKPQPAADFILPDLKGQQTALSQFKDKQPVLLVFWTTWCPYCRQQLKFLKERSIDLEKDKIKLLAINVAEDERKVASFVDANAIEYTVLLDKDTVVADSFNLLGVPTYVLINRQGQVVYNDNAFPKDYKKLVS